MMLAEGVVLAIGDLNLIGLHAYLKYKGWTTYEYLMEKKKKSKKIHSIKEKKSQKRDSSEQENNNTILGSITLDGRASDP